MLQSVFSCVEVFVYQYKRVVIAVTAAGNQLRRCWVTSEGAGATSGEWVGRDEASTWCVARSLRGALQKSPHHGKFNWK